jgi:hypothetical protein
MNGNFHHQYNLSTVKGTIHYYQTIHMLFYIFATMPTVISWLYNHSYYPKSSVPFVKNRVHYRVQNYRSLSHGNLIHTKPLPNSISCSTINFIVIFTSVFQPCPFMFFTYNFALSYAWYMPCPSHSHRLDICWILQITKFLMQFHSFIYLLGQNITLNTPL